MTVTKPKHSKGPAAIENLLFIATERKFKERKALFYFTGGPIYQYKLDTPRLRM